MQHADSEGELLRAEGLGSAGSSSTLVSSVIEVGAERLEGGTAPQLRPKREEEEVFQVGCMKRGLAVACATG